MKLFRLQTLKSLWTLKPPYRAFHGHARLLVSDVHSQYDSIRRGKQEIPKYFNFASDVLDKWSEIEKAGKRPPNPAFWWINGKGDEVKWSFEELGFLSRKVANVLTKVCGLQKGDRIITILPRVPEWWLVYVACMRTGIVLIPGTSQLSAKDILYRLQASKAMCIITSDTVAPAVDSVASECQFLKSKLIVSKGKREGWLNLTDLYKNQSADHSCVKTKIQDPMSIFFTSGSTGYPKMAEHSQGSLGFRPLLSERYWLNSSPSDIVWCTADTGWILAAVASLIDPWIFGSCIFVHMLPKIESAAILNTLCEFPVETLVGAPTLFRMLVQNDLSSYKFMNLKHCMSGGEPLNPEVMEQWKSKTGLDIHEVYGQTEAGLICCVFKGMKIKPGSMGKAVPIYDVQIIDKNANILPPGQQGEIAIRSKPLRPLGLFSQYVDNPKKTAESERGDFYVTGDRAIMDEDGYFQFIGRDDDIIISSGYRIGPFEVESALIEHPAVAETAVISSPDPLRGEVVKAFVVLSPTFSSSDLESLTCDLQEHVKKTTAPYKYPRKVIKDNGNILLPGEGGNLAIQIKPAKPFGLFPRYVVVKAFIVPSAEFTSHDPEKLVLQLQKHVKKSYCTLQIVHKARKVSLKIPLCCCHRLLDLYIESVRLPSMLVPFCNDIKPELEQETNEETNGRSETFLFGVRAGVPALPHQTGLHATRGVGVCSTTTKDDLWENPKRVFRLPFVQSGVLGVSNRPVREELHHLPRVVLCYTAIKSCSEFYFLGPGVIIIPGTIQLAAQDICYGLLASKAKCIIAADVLAPAMNSVVSKCQLLKMKLIVSESSRAE